MDIVNIEDDFEQTFWDHVNQDPLHYYFFILDWKQRRERTKILLAMEGKIVEGLVLIYADCIVQLRGTRKAVERLLDYVTPEKVELQAPLDCEDLVMQKYSPQKRHELMLMSLERGRENIIIRHTPVKLGAGDTEEVSGIMRRADPEWWGDMTVERQKESLEKAFWLGIRDGEQVVSVGSTRFVDFASNIGVVATDERYRNRGYATSIVSALVREILKNSPTALIHVLSNNAPATRVYSRIGFKPYKHYLLMRAERIKG